jgi:dTDP-glucose 4,6-dehydratase
MANNFIAHHNKTILVTGGAGFIGSNFILHWLERYPQDKIINLDALTYAGNPANLDPVADESNYVFIEGNINDQALVNKIADDVDWIVHFAAESHVDRSLKNPQLFLETNVLGTQVLLEAALQHNVERFHHISTDEVFGALSLESKQKFKENTCYDPRSPYSASKAASDHLVRAYGESYQLPFTISNCSNNYGPLQFPEKYIALAITNLMSDRPIPIYGDGQYVRDWLYVNDHCRAIEQILLKGQLGETYLVGGMTQDVNNLDLAKQIVSLMIEKKLTNLEQNQALTMIKDRPGHDRRYAVDWSKIKNELGWQPRLSLSAGLEKTIDWYQAHQDWWQPLKAQNQDWFQEQYQATN